MSNYICKSSKYGNSNKPSLFTLNSATAFIKKQILCYNQAVSLSRLNKVKLIFLEPKTHK